MKYYYFIIRDDRKEGPLKLEDLKNLKLKKDTLVWRSDFDNWKPISELEELVEFIYKSPPKTDKELIKEAANRKFNKWLKNAVPVYIIASIFIAIFSTMIAFKSYEEFQKKIKGKYSNNIHYNENSNFSSPNSSVYESELMDNNRYPIYKRGADLESINSSKQGDFLRVYKSFYQTVYLSKEERESMSKLFFNLLFSSFLTNFIFFIIIIIYYNVKVLNEPKRDNIS